MRTGYRVSVMVVMQEDTAAGRGKQIRRQMRDEKTIVSTELRIGRCVKKK